MFLLKKPFIIAVITIYFLTCFSLAQEKTITVTEKDLGGKIYSGELRNGKPHGKGKILYERYSDRYEGDFVDGKRNGEGTYYYWSGDVYKGGWKDNLQEGYGVHTRKSTGTIIEGQHSGGRLHGPVKRTYKNGEVREGNFTRGKQNGTFRHTFGNGRIIELNFVNKKVQGDTAVIAPGEGPLPGAGSFVIHMPYKKGKYTGDIRNGIPHGKGRFLASNNEIYEGEWQNGEYWGEGFMYLPSGSRYKGEWVNGKFEGKGHYVWKNGAMYNGEWKNGKRNGFGKFKTPGGDVGEGSFKNDKKYGKFTFTNADGSLRYHTYTEDEAAKKPKIVPEKPAIAVAENTDDKKPARLRKKEAKLRERKAALAAKKEAEKKKAAKAPEKAVVAEKPAEPPLQKGPIGFYKNYLHFMADGYKTARFEKWLRDIGHANPRPDDLLKSAYTAQGNGVELVWSYGLLEKIIFTKKELPKSNAIRKHIEQYAFADYTAAGVRQNGRITRSLFWRSDDESIFLEFKNKGNLKKKKAEKVTLELKIPLQKRIDLYAKIAGAELSHHHFKALITMPFKSVPVQYWLKKSPKPFTKSGSGRTWTYSQDELGVSIGYINWGGTGKRHPREPYGQMIAENVKINPWVFKGKLPGGLTAEELEGLIADNNMNELNKYYTRITHQSYDEYKGTRKDYLMSPKDGGGILWLEYRNDKLGRITYDNASYDAMLAKMKGEKNRAGNFIWKKRSEAVAEARKRDLKKNKKKAMEGDKTVGVSWRGGRYIPFINEHGLDLGKPPHGQGVWVYKGISYEGFFLKGWMEREFTISDKHGNVGRGKMYGKHPIGKWTVTQNGQQIIYYFTKQGQVREAEMNGKSLMKKGVSDRIVYYELVYRAVQSRSDGRVIDRASDDYGGKDLRLKIAELSYSSLLSDERRINNNLNFKLLESKMYVEARGTCNCNNYYSWAGWELISCRKLDSEPKKVDLQYDTCAGWYLPDEFTPFWIQ